MNLVQSLASTLIILTLPCQVHSAQHVIVIGGGPTPVESQASIELNTKWIIDLTRQSNPDAKLHILYTDGNAPDVDVHKQGSKPKQRELYEPLARVYGKEQENDYHFYSSNIAKDIMMADKKHVTETLRKVFSNLKSHDKLFLVYQGHGGYHKNDTNGNFLRLWKNTKITVTELESLMRMASPSSTIRYIFPQCFSGAFSRLIYKNAAFKNGLAKGTRCGFLAQNEHHSSEGCTPSVETETYRDYSSYFFSALSGKSISGQIIDENPDYNHDGKVTLWEAHQYSITNAFSVDHSLSTSEAYLEDWQPWHLRWLPYTPNTRSTYEDIVQRVAARFNIQSNNVNILREAANRISTITSRIEKKRYSLDILDKSIKMLQNNIKQKLLMIWPQLRHPYTREYIKTTSSNIKKIQQKISSHSDYLELIDKQKKYHSLAMQTLNLKRELAQMRKIFRMRRMNKLLEKFNRYASEEKKSEYKQLQNCEHSTLE